MTSSIGLWSSAEEDGLSLLRLERTGADVVAEKEFYYRLEDVDVPVRFRLVELIGGRRLDARYTEASGWIAAGEFKLDEFEGALFGEVVELRVKYRDLRDGCGLVVLLKEIGGGGGGDDSVVYTVKFPLVGETLAQGRYSGAVHMEGPAVSATLLHLETVIPMMHTSY